MPQAQQVNMSPAHLPWQKKETIFDADAENGERWADFFVQICSIHPRCQFSPEGLVHLNLMPQSQISLQHIAIQPDATSTSTSKIIAVAEPLHLDTCNLSAPGQ